MLTANENFCPFLGLLWRKTRGFFICIALVIGYLVLETLLQQFDQVGLGLPVASTALQLFVLVFAKFAWALCIGVLVFTIPLAKAIEANAQNLLFVKQVIIFTARASFKTAETLPASFFRPPRFTP